MQDLALLDPLLDSCDKGAHDIGCNKGDDEIRCCFRQEKPTIGINEACAYAYKESALPLTFDVPLPWAKTRERQCDVPLAP